MTRATELVNERGYTPRPLDVVRANGQRSGQGGAEPPALRISGLTGSKGGMRTASVVRRWPPADTCHRLPVLLSRLLS